MFLLPPNLVPLFLLAAADGFLMPRRSGPQGYCRNGSQGHSSSLTSDLRSPSFPAGQAPRRLSNFQSVAAWHPLSPLWGRKGDPANLVLSLGARIAVPWKPGRLGCSSSRGSRGLWYRINSVASNAAIMYVGSSTIPCTCRAAYLFLQPARASNDNSRCRRGRGDASRNFA